MQGLMGRMVTVQPCRRCRGEGRVIEQPCTRCHGEGRSRAQREVTVEVPPGVSSENYITLRGEGSVGPQGGPRGDVLVLIEVEDDPRFVRDEADLLTEKPITLSQAVLGAEVQVATVDSRVKLTVPAGIQSGTVMRLRGQGLPELQGRGRGDLLVRVLVYTPQSLSDEQRRLFNELAELEEEAPERVERNDDKGFWSRVREAFSGR